MVDGQREGALAGVKGQAGRGTRPDGEVRHHVAGLYMS